MGSTHGNPVLADLLLTPGHKSVVFGNYGGQLWVVKHDGTVPAGMPLLLPGDVYSTPAVGDLDGDGLPDIVVGYGSTFDPSKPGGFRAYKNHGPGANPVFTQLWDHPTLNTEPPAVTDPVMSSPAIGDVDGDGIVEVAVGGLDYNIYLVDGRNGNNKPGWPYANTDTIFSSPALFDLDGDGKLEIIIGADYSIGTGGRLHAFRPDASELPGFPVAMDQAMSSSPAVGDIDGDGKPEIVIGTANYFSGRAHKLYAFHCNGSAVLGWPVSVDGQVKGAPALGDLDGDGIPDVVACDDNSGPSATYHVYAFKGSGNAVAGWAGGKQPKGFFGETLGAGDPVIADILNGPEPEVLVPTNGEICVLSNTGVQLTDNGNHVTGTFTFNVGGSVGGVAVGDFDNNGAAVSVVAISGAPFPTYNNSQVYAWNTGKAVGVLPWPQFRHDAKHTGVLPGTPTCAPRAVVPTKFFPLDALPPPRHAPARARGACAAGDRLARESPPLRGGARERLRDPDGRGLDLGECRRDEHRRPGGARDLPRRRLAAEHGRHQLPPPENPGQQRPRLPVRNRGYVHCLQQLCLARRLHSRRQRVFSVRRDHYLSKHILS